MVELDLWMQPIFNWCLELLDSPKIVGQFRWNAERISRHNGEEFIRIFNEPWTANRWWEIQVRCHFAHHQTILAS
jgi:hypothetical protein